MFNNFIFLQDLESRISEQNSVLAEMERRTEIYRKEAETARKWTSSIGAINFGKVRLHNLKSKFYSSLSRENSNHISAVCLLKLHLY